MADDFDDNPMTSLELGPDRKTVIFTFDREITDDEWGALQADFLEDLDS